MGVWHRLRGVRSAKDPPRAGDGHGGIQGRGRARWHSATILAGLLWGWHEGEAAWSTRELSQPGKCPEFTSMSWSRLSSPQGVQKLLQSRGHPALVPWGSGVPGMGVAQGSGMGEPFPSHPHQQSRG